ncbi:MAG: hypothetical protein L6R40_000769 [Gallowayella cf. fulva]|nr:MAG: hypothetical protein L6R40_000769 [Xanthomendoza cf. fulva]
MASAGSMQFTTEDGKSWDLTYEELEYLLTTAKTWTQGRDQAYLTAVTKALCGFRRRMPDRFDKLSNKDLKHIWSNLRFDTDKKPFLTSWEQGSLGQRETDAQIEMDVYHLQNFKKKAMRDMRVVTTETELLDPNRFPTGVLDHLLAGFFYMKSIAEAEDKITKADLAKALQILYPPSTRDPKKDQPFTAANVQLIFDYLRLTGQNIYDEWMLGSDPRLERQDNWKELKETVANAKTT